MTCGEPAAVEVVVSVRRLRLERDAGAHTRAYWQGSYKNETDVRTVLCDGCVRANVSVSVGVSATLAAATATREPVCPVAVVPAPAAGTGR